MGAIDFGDTEGKVLSPAAFAHVVLRTGDLEKMTDFYVTFLGGRIVHRNDFLSFITYDEEHHRIALIGVPGTAPKNRQSCGLEHTAFTFPTLSALLLSYRQRKAKGILPVWNINHGPTTSLYYRDPDGNMIETQVDNFKTSKEATDFMTSDLFAQNPVGTDFDPEELIAKLEEGVDENVLLKRPEIGVREFPDIDSI